MSGTCVSGGATVRKGASRTKQVLRACATLLIVFGLVSVAGAQASPPTVEGFAPTIGYRGAIVRLEGSGFSEVSQVRFGVTRAVFSIVSDTAIDATVPAGATSGPLSIESPTGSVVSAATFTVQADVVLILTDDQRWDMLRFPTLQAEMVAKGVTFTQAFVPNPICCPSRASILTGRYPHGTDIWKNRPPRGGYETFAGNGIDSSTMATWLDAAGYTTGLVGKYLNGYDPADIASVPPGWDRWVALALAGTQSGDRGGYYDYLLSVDGVGVPHGSTEADYSTDVLAGFATDFIAGAPSDQPLLLLFAPRAPHTPTTVAPRHSTASTDLPPLDSPSVNEADVSDKPSFIRTVPPLTPAQVSDIQRRRTHHYRSLLAVDDAVGEIILQLGESGRLQDTMIIFMSDNGLAFGEHRWQGKEVPYEESIRVPFVVRYDALTDGTAATIDEIVLNLDVAPTFADVAGVGATGSDGRSLVGLLAGTEASWRTDFLLEHARTSLTTVAVPAYCGVRTASWKYVRYSDGQEELYDLASDPFELQNLATAPELADEKALLLQRTRELCVPRPPKYAPF